MTGGGEFDVDDFIKSASYKRIIADVEHSVFRSMVYAVLVAQLINFIAVALIFGAFLLY